MSHITLPSRPARRRWASLVLAGALAFAATSTWLAATAPSAHAAESARTKYKAAKAKFDAGSYSDALVVIEEGLRLDAKHKELLLLKASTFMKVRRYEEAHAAYQAYFAAGGKSSEAKQTMEALEKSILPTRFELVAPAGAAGVSVVVKDLPFCVPSPTCVKAVIAGQYTISAEAEGYEPWSGEATAVAGQTVTVEVKLVEKPSLLTIKTTPELAAVTVDGQPFTSPGPIPAGTHQVSAALRGRATTAREISARLGKPVELTVELPALTLATLEPADATWLLDGQPLVIDNGGVALPPGKHVVTGKAAGYRDGKLTIEADRPADYQLALKLTRQEQVASGPSLWTPRRKFAVVSAGVSALAIGAGIYLGLDAKKLEDDSFEVCPVPDNCRDPDRANDLIDRADSRALQANIAYGVAGAAAVGAAVLWFTGKPEAQQRVSVTPRVAAPASGGSITGVDLSLKF